MKTNLIASALLVLGLGLVGGTTIVSAAPPSQCATGASECVVARVYQYDPDSDGYTWMQFPNIPAEQAASTANVVVARVYQYDPDSDGYTWMQFPNIPAEQAASTTNVLEARASSDNRVAAGAPELTSRVYQYDPDSDAFTWFQFSSPATDNSIIPSLDPMSLGDNGD